MFWHYTVCIQWLSTMAKLWIPLLCITYKTRLSLALSFAPVVMLRLVGEESCDIAINCTNACRLVTGRSWELKHKLCLLDIVSTRLFQRKFYRNSNYLSNGLVNHLLSKLLFVTFSWLNGMQFILNLFNFMKDMMHNVLSTNVQDNSRDQRFRTAGFFYWVYVQFAK